MDPLTRAWLKVVIDGQAYLYARLLSEQVLDGSPNTTEVTFKRLQYDWKEESAKLVQELLDDDDADSVSLNTNGD